MPAVKANTDLFPSMQVPFVKRAPLVTFQKPIGSVSVSGHKFVGAPVPCGVVITRTRYVEALANSIEYLNSRDATIMGSRNGHAPIYLWYTLTRKGYEGMRQDVERCLLNAHKLKVPSADHACCFCGIPDSLECHLLNAQKLKGN